MVSGVRSSCDRLSMNSARIRCRRRSSDTSSMTSHTPETGERRARTVTVAPGLERTVTSPLAEPSSIAVRAIALDPGVYEGLQRGPPDHGTRPPLQHHVSRAVGELHGQVVAQSNHARRQQLGQVAGVVAASARRSSEHPRPPRGPSGPASRRRRRRTRRSSPAAVRSPDREISRPPAPSRAESPAR